MKRAQVVVPCILSSAAAFTQRLPQTALPDHYAVTLAPDLKNAKFSGEETIAVQAVPQADEVMNQCVDMRARQEPRLASWLEAKKSSAGH